MNQFFETNKLVLTGNPVRKDIENLETKLSEAKTYFKVSKNEKVILVLGGSLEQLSHLLVTLNLIQFIKDQPVKLLGKLAKDILSPLKIN